MPPLEDYCWCPPTSVWTTTASTHHTLEPSGVPHTTPRRPTSIQSKAVAIKIAGFLAGRHNSAVTDLLRARVIWLFFEHPPSAHRQLVARIQTLTEQQGGRFPIVLGQTFSPV